jgi:ribosomal-protein-alanine N-acetyltransferase
LCLKFKHRKPKFCFNFIINKKMFSMCVAVQEASLKHLDKLYEIETECFKEEAFTKEQIANLLKDYSSVSLVAKVNDEIVGFITGRAYTDRKPSAGRVLTIDVSPEHRRKGIGLKLLLEVERVFRNKRVNVCYLETREDNIAALNLYQKHGYKMVGKLKNYYRKAHGVRLTKSLGRFQ